MKTLYDRGLALGVHRKPNELDEHGRHKDQRGELTIPPSGAWNTWCTWTFRGWGVQETLEIYSTLAEYVHAKMCIVDQQWESS
ncbi:hypothetical protein KI387_018485, partial [Taxus chinensis]